MKGIQIVKKLAKSPADKLKSVKILLAKLCRVFIQPAPHTISYSGNLDLGVFSSIHVFYTKQLFYCILSSVHNCTAD